MLDDIRDEVDRILEAGGHPDPAEWAGQYPVLATEIEALVGLRLFLREEGLDGGEAESDERELSEEETLAAIQGELQDALNRGETPDLGRWQARHPRLAPRIESLARRLDMVNDALLGDMLSCPAREATDRGALGKFRLHYRIATHAAGPIYLAEDESGERRVELLILRPMIDDEDAWRILKDAELTREVELPGFAPVSEVGEVRGVRFIAWDHAAGRSVDEVLARLSWSPGVCTLADALSPDAEAPPSNPDEDSGTRWRHAAAAAAALARRPEHLASVAMLVAKVARHLAAAHRKGILDLDLRPESILVDAAGDPLIRGIGLGRCWRLLPTEEDGVGIYRAPEQVFPGTAPIDWRADVYRTGALLYTLLRLEPPYRVDGRGVRELFLEGPPKLGSSVPDLPAGLEEIVDAAMSRSPDFRIPTCEVLAERLEALARGLVSGPEVAPTGSASRGLLARLRRRFFGK